MFVGDEFQHQIDRGGATCGRHPVAVYHEDRFRQLDLVEFLQEAVLVFPMDGGLLAIKQPGLGHGIGRRAQPADRAALARLAAQPVEQAFGRGLRHIHAAAQDDRLVAGDLVQFAIQRQRRAARGRNAAAALTDQPPAVSSRPDCRFALRSASTAQAKDKSVNSGIRTKAILHGPPSGCRLGMGVFIRLSDARTEWLRCLSIHGKHQFFAIARRESPLEAVVKLPISGLRQDHQEGARHDRRLDEIGLESETAGADAGLSGSGCAWRGRGPAGPVSSAGFRR